MTDNLIPLAILAAEHGLTINQLAARLGENVLVDDATGLRYCTPETARQLHEQRLARREREQRRAAERKAQLAELNRRYRAELRGGVPTTPGSTPYADMVGVDR